MTSPGFSPELSQKIRAARTRYETPRSAILPVLHEIQREKRWISPADVELLEREYEFSAVDIQEVLTFYTMYRQKEPKPFVFEVCNSISCWLSGSEETLKALNEKMSSWKAAHGEEPPFEVHSVACLGICGHAPVAFVNEDRHLRVTPELALKLVDDYCSGAKGQSKGRNVPCQ